MYLRWLVAAVHLLGLGIGLGAIIGRARALRAPLDESRLPAVFFADNLWGLAAVLWIATGVWRAFGGLEKGSAYYLSSTAFWIKMGMLGAILALEIVAAAKITRWRVGRAKDRTPDLSFAPTIARISVVQALLVVGMVFAATAMARGIGL